MSWWRNLLTRNSTVSQVARRRRPWSRLPSTQIELLENRLVPSTFSPLDINVGSAGSSPSGLLALGNKVYFAASDGSTGTQLWVSDGTAAGTTRLTNVNTGGGGLNPTGLVAMNGDLYFSGNDGSHGVELWKYHAGSASMIADINAGAGSSSPGSL